MGKDHRRNRVANAYFSLFMAVGNVLGFATGSYSDWYKIFSFTVTSACDPDCANLKSAFLLHVAFIAITTYISILAADELPLNHEFSHLSEEIPEQSSHAQEAFLWELFATFRYLSRPIWIILLVTALTWMGWFPFLLFDTDWMGREIYGGEPNEGQNYSRGVRMGAFGLMLNSVVLGLTSLLMEKLCRKLGTGVVWGISNILMSLCFVSMLIITHIANNAREAGDNQSPDGVVAAALVVFAILGFPLAEEAMIYYDPSIVLGPAQSPYKLLQSTLVLSFLWRCPVSAITYSIPYALISSHIESLGLGQGLSMGVLNLAIVIPQV
ncbi:sugar transporter protein [Sarracenia purpurea var. burkii]